MRPIFIGMERDQPRRMGRPCKTCNSPDLSEINVSMRDGQTLDAMSRRFGLYPQALGRHRQNHLAGFEK